MIVAQYAANEIGAPADEELYGIEIEAEGFSPLLRGREGSALAHHWNIKEDGSLRNNGIEFVSKLLPADKVSNAVHHLYGRTRALWEPSVRTGIHIHANMLARTFDDVRRILAYYSFVEPLLFQFVGPVREENIYCVPFYRAPEEARLSMDALTRDPFRLRETCKYSALFVGPLRTFGTIEFRHAPTFDTADDLVLWWKLCRCVAQSWQLRDPFEVYAEGGPSAVVAEVFGDLWDRANWSAQDMDDLITGTGAEEVAFLFQPYTYKASEWGVPGKFFVADTAPKLPRGATLLPMLGPDEIDIFSQALDDYQESDDSDEEDQ
jgi:hypothetical protein